MKTILRAAPARAALLLSAPALLAAPAPPPRPPRALALEVRFEGPGDTLVVRAGAAETRFDYGNPCWEEALRKHLVAVRPKLKNQTEWTIEGVENTPAGVLIRTVRLCRDLGWKKCTLRPLKERPARRP